MTASWVQIHAEAAELVAAAAEQGMTVRVVGSAGIRMHCAEALAAMDDVERAAKDLDVVVRSADRSRLRSMLEARGYVVDRDLLVAMEGQRFAFRHPERDLDLDVFVERLQFCHTIELDGRWERHATTIPIEDLLLRATSTTSSPSSPTRASTRAAWTATSTPSSSAARTRSTHCSASS